MGHPSRTLDGNSRKRSESVSGVFPEFFRWPRFGFGSVTVWGWNGSSGSAFRFRRFLYGGGFSVFQYNFTEMTVPVPVSVPGKPRGPKDQKNSRFRAGLKISSENEIFERATHRGPIFCGQIETSRLKFSSEIKNFDRDQKFRSGSNFFDRWALWERFRRFRFRVRFLENRFRRFRFPAPVRFLGHPEVQGRECHLRRNFSEDHNPKDTNVLKVGRVQRAYQQRA